MDGADFNNTDDVDPEFSYDPNSARGLLHWLQTVAPQQQRQQMQAGSFPGRAPNLSPNPNGLLMPGALASLAILGAHALQQHFSGNNGDAAPEPVDPNFRALARRPSAFVGDQTIPSDIGTGLPGSNPTTNLPGSLAAKPYDPSKPVRILGAPEDSPVPNPDDEDDDCMRQRNKERAACFRRQKRNPKWDYLNECLDRATVRWDLCNRGIDPGNLKPWGRRNE